MKRECSRCGRPFTPQDLARTESRNMEADRKAAGLDGVRFLYYRCPCGTDGIFVDILPRPDEPAQEFDRRRDEMEGVVRQMHADHVEARVVPVKAPAAG
jgi:hypothetical protein